MTVGNFAEIPIPTPAKAITALDYHQVLFDKKSEHCGEPLCNALAHGIAGESYYARSDGRNAPYNRQFLEAPPEIFLRKSVVEKLLLVNQSLRPLGLELFLLDGYRPIAVQKELWKFFLDEAERRLPNPSSEEKKRFAGQFVSNPERFDPSDETTWPIHSTGGAVDLTLRRIGSSELACMGGSFDDPTEISFTNYYEGKSSDSDREAKKNRRILYHAMRAEDFTNYPCEWWHFDYGTQMWALLINLEEGITTTKAIYPTIQK